jgi:hypothetical protein
MLKIRHCDPPKRMTMKAADRKSGDGPLEQQSADVRPVYEPPTLTVIGSITEFTFGSGGSKSDAGMPVRL